MREQSELPDPLGLTIGSGTDQAVFVEVDRAAGELRLRRSLSGIAFDDLFPSTGRAPLEVLDGRIELDMYIDACSIEIFAQQLQRCETGS